MVGVYGEEDGVKNLFSDWGIDGLSSTRFLCFNLFGVYRLAVNSKADLSELSKVKVLKR